MGDDDDSNDCFRFEEEDDDANSMACIISAVRDGKMDVVLTMVLTESFFFRLLLVLLL
jgi:hypothetical protein